MANIIMYDLKSNVLATPFSMYAYVNKQCTCNIDVHSTTTTNIALGFMASMQTCPLLMKGL